MAHLMYLNLAKNNDIPLSDNQNDIQLFHQYV